MLKKWLKRWFSYGDGLNTTLVEPTLSGVHIDEEKALSITSVYCAVTTISSLIAGLPLCLYQTANKDRRQATEHPLYALLRYRPNGETTKEQHWQTVLAHVLLYGNSYQEIERDESGRPVALHVLPPTHVAVGRDDELGLYYQVNVAPGRYVYLRPDQCFHVAGLSLDGLTGCSPVRHARESLALTASLERFGASFFGNSARPAGILQTPTVLSPNARENLRKSWAQMYEGTANTGRTVLLEEGVQFTPISIPAEDAQFIQTRGYQIQEVARLFNISPVFLHATDGAWTDLESTNRALVQVTLMPWLLKIEAQIRAKLLTGDERPSYFAEHDLTQLLRADTKERYESYAVAINSGWMLRSEARANERLDPIDGIDRQDQEQDQEQDGTTEPQN